MKSRLGNKGGVVPTAHKLARIIYSMIKEQQPYDKNIVEHEEQKWKQTRIIYLEKQLEQLRKSG